MTYYTIEITDLLSANTYKHTNIRNLGQAILFAIRFSRGMRRSTVIDQTTGAVIAEYELGDPNPVYFDHDPYAGY